MIIKEAVYKNCGECGKAEAVSNDEYGCDGCQKPMVDYFNGDHLRLTVFHQDHNKNSENMHFCSWKCCLKRLRKIKTDYFVSLPYLHYDSRHKGQTAKDFLKLLKAVS